MISCYYPTTTIIIDDDVDFLEAMTQHLGIANCNAYSSPIKAIESLQDKKSFQRIRSRLLKTAVAPEEMNPNSEDDQAFLLNLHGLHEEIYSAKRFNDISVMIVDYYMDGINGIEVCEKFSSHPAKKILLTGGADKEKIAIEAFNKGMIHRFINKKDKNFSEQLKQAVVVLKEAYFNDLSSMLLPYIPSKNIIALQSPAYINFTRNLQVQFNTIEYYLLDTSGSMIFFDEQATPVWLIVKHHSEINHYKRIAEENDADINIIRTQDKYEKIPFFFTEEDHQKPASKWNDHLYSSLPFPGMNGYYYAIIEGHVRNNLRQEKIIPYNLQAA